METVLKAIADWIKGILTAGIMSNLSGLFDDVNTQVGNIAQQVGTKPSNFEPRVFAMIEALSRNVVLPIAGIILTFIACYELIEMITQHNNMAQFEPALIMRWIFKTAVSVWLISNTFDIVMAVFDITQKVVSDSSGIIAGNTRVNDISYKIRAKRDDKKIIVLEDVLYDTERDAGTGLGTEKYRTIFCRGKGHYRENTDPINEYRRGIFLFWEGFLGGFFSLCSSFVEQCACYPYIFPTILPRAAAGRSLHKRLRNLYCAPAT